MKTLELQLPDDLDVDNKDLKCFMAAKLFEAGILSLSQAAESTGYTISEFMHSLNKYNVSVFNYPASDLASDVKNAEESIR